MASDDQIEMSDWVHTHVRQESHSTSIQAAHRACLGASSIKARIYRYLLADPEPRSYEQLSAALGIQESSVWKRLSDLKNDGLIEPSGEVHRNASGSDSIRWQPTPWVRRAPSA
jgi:predicted transcriptional regulator